MILALLKDSHLIQLQDFVKTKKFVDRKALKEQHSMLEVQVFDNFEAEKVSTNMDVVKELKDLLLSQLNSNYDKIYAENERKMNQFIDISFNDIRLKFEKEVNCLFEADLIDHDRFIESITQLKEKFLLEFKQLFGNNEEEVFKSFISKVLSDPFIRQVFN